MRQTWVWVVLVIVALVAGFFGGQMTKGGQAVSEDLKAKIDRLEKDVSDLKAQLAARPGGGLRVAYINAEKVFQEYKRTGEAVERFRVETEKKKQELEGLQDQLKKGKISENDFQREAARIQQELQRLDLELTAPIQGEMIKVIEGLAKEQGYDWVTQRKDVVLYANPSVLVDITYRVLERLNAP